MQKGHGIPDCIAKEIRSISRQFFDLPYDEKLKIKLSPTTGFRSAARNGDIVVVIDMLSH